MSLHGRRTRRKDSFVAQAASPVGGLPGAASKRPSVLFQDCPNGQWQRPLVPVAVGSRPTETSRWCGEKACGWTADVMPMYKYGTRCGRRAACTCTRPEVAICRPFWSYWETSFMIPKVSKRCVCVRVSLPLCVCSILTLPFSQVLQS